MIPQANGGSVEVFVPDGATDGVPVVVLLHGRGADRTDLFALRRFLPDGWAVVAPDAPFPAAPWGYGPGRAWYQYLGRNRPEPDSFQRSLEHVDDLLTRLPEIIGREPGPVALGGFSQGGAVSMGYALTHRRPGLSIVNFSGFLADHPAVAPTPEAVAGARFFWGHGTADPAIPFALAIEGRELLARAGADLETRDYHMGHGISPDELADAVTWLQPSLDR
ncbi:MAG TPA: alpha/beta fold hydrolase [Longimicrobiales bacterium]